MNKVIRNSLLLTALAVMSNVQADDAHNQTFLNPRSHGVNLALENVNGWQKLIHRKGADDTFGGNFQVIGYYMASTDEEELGEYFAPATHPADNTLKDNDFNFGSAAGNTAVTQTLNFRNFVHQRTDIAVGETVKLSLNPEQRAYGVTLNYHQDLDKILKGLYFKINVPIVNVENSIDPEYAAGAVPVAALAEVGNPLLAPQPSALDALKGYFDGTFSNNAANNSQAALQFLKFGAKNNEDSSTGVADIDFILGYYFLYKNKYRLAVNMGFTIPTGDDAECKKLFEAIVGNGDHWALGAGFDGGATMWHDGDHSLTFHSALNYRYLFEGTEKRTLGLKDAAGNIIPWGHYALVGKSNTAGGAVTLVPAANMLTVDCDVTPGSQLDMIVAFAYHYCGFTFDLGYNMFFREEEDVDRKGSTAIFGELTVGPNSWGIVNPDVNTSVGIADNGSSFVNGLTLVDSKNVTTANAETPSQLTHKIYAGVAYATYGWDVPLFVGLNGHYEWASDNSGISNWGIGAKAGVAF